VTAGSDNKRDGQSMEGGMKQRGNAASRPGLPAKSSILSEKTFVSPGKRRYRIIRTSERDPYDEPDPADGKKRE
jgi:hypothetical protein